MHLSGLLLPIFSACPARASASHSTLAPGRAPDPSARRASLPAYPVGSPHTGADNLNGADNLKNAILRQIYLANRSVSSDAVNTIAPFIEETRFGNWFLKSDTWKKRVLCRALDDLQRLMPQERNCYSRVIDVGCGFGHAFAELARRFSPDLILGLDADPELIARAGEPAADCSCEVRLHPANAACMDLPDAEFDLADRCPR